MRDLTQQREKLKAILKDSKRALITMSAPDGDSIGSAIALKLILDQNDINSDIICSFDLGGRFSNYPHSSEIYSADLGRVDFTLYDVCLTVDSGQLARLVKPDLYPDGFKFPKKLEVINIDHHESNDNFGTLNVNFPDASCTSEIIDALFDEMYVMDSYLATLMYFSVVYDTVNFRWNITDHLFEFGLKCIRNGANVEEVINDFFNSRSLDQTKFEGVLLERMQHDNNYVFTMAYHDDLERYNIDLGKYLNATATIARDYLSSFKDADFGWVISERKNSVVKVEMRAKIENTPILEIAEALGGGGHKKACGVRIQNKTLDEVQDFILEYLK